MKKIVLFKGGVETLGFFSQQLEKAFQELGHETFMYDYDKEADSTYHLLRFIKRGETIMLSFNFHGICNEDVLRDDDNKYIWEELDIPCYNIVVDHPFYYDRFIWQLPANYTQLSIDLNHLDYMKRFYPNICNGPFLPLGGTELDWEDEMLPVSERPLDIIFTGSWAKPSFWEQFMSKEGPEYEEFYHRVLEKQLNNPDKTFEEIFEPMIRAEAEDADDITDDMLRDAYSHMIHFDMYVRYYYRGELIKRLIDSGLKVVCIGGGWDHLDVAHPENLIHYGYTTSIDCLREIRRAKISVNVMPWFKRGAHDRIFNSMLNGSVCFTDSSQYLDSFLEDGVNCLTFNLNELDKAADKIKNALKSDSLLQSIADNGYRLAKNNHTWANRARCLHELIES